MNFLHFRQSETKRHLVLQGETPSVTQGHLQSHGIIELSFKLSRKSPGEKDMCE